MKFSHYIYKQTNQTEQTEEAISAVAVHQFPPFQAPNWANCATKLSTLLKNLIFCLFPMNCTLCSYPIVGIPFLFQNPKPLKTLTFNHTLPGSKPLIALNKTLNYVNRRRFIVRCELESDGESGNWINRLPRGAFGADKLFRLISGATASPICQFISSPKTFLHSVDPRVKLVCSIFSCFLLDLSVVLLLSLICGYGFWGS